MTNHSSFSFFLAGWILFSSAAAQAASLIPYPKQIVWGANTNTFDGVVSPFPDGSPLDRELRDVFSDRGIVLKKQGTRPLHLTLNATAPNALSEAYTLESTGSTLALTAPDSPSLFNALQTFRQLIETAEGGGFTLPECRIEDAPAFAIRGVMFDVGRYYLPPAFIKETIRRLSHYKINTLHLHLTDDPAWRIEIKRYPQLTRAEAHWPTRRPGKYYTQEELREIVAFCADLNITVIPEIDMPGHSEAFRKALGFSMQTPEGLEAIGHILDEALPLFPGKLFHLGSDETPLTMPGFMAAATERVRRDGKIPVVWSPGLNPAGDAVVTAWGENERGSPVDPALKTIDTNGFYLDWMDAQSGVWQVFFQQPCGVPRGNERALGSIMNVWADGALSSEQRILEQYPFYPCMLTFAERLWRGAPERRRDLMAQLPQKGTPEWAAFDEFENRLIDHRDRFFKGKPFAYVKQSHIAWRVIGPFDHGGQNDRSFPPETAIHPNYGALSWLEEPVYGGAIWFRHLYAMFDMHRGIFRINHWPTAMSKALGTGSGTCYALTYVESPQEQEIFLMLGFNGLWGHSGGYRTAPAPPQGSWDFSGGDIWLNDARIPPPAWPFESLPWGGWGKGRIETPLTEEGYFFRPPVKITLKKGMNKLLIRSVFGHWKGDTGQRKWFFCCIPVNWDGTHYTEVKGLKWHPVLPGEQEKHTGQ